MQNKQSLLHDFGQLFILAFDGPRLTPELVGFLKRFNIGGLILFSDNFESREHLGNLVRDIQARCSNDFPLLITSDHEGGRNQHFTTDFTIIPPMAKVGGGSFAATKSLMTQVGQELKGVGISMNFAPVADLCLADAEGSIGDRSFGADAAQVSGHVVAAIEGLWAGGVLPCVKHFPGHGATSKRSHHELPSIALDEEVLEKRDLLPFVAALEAGVPAVMTAHIVYPQSGDPQWPASLSEYWLQEVLRKRMGFEGVIVSDALEMKAMTNHWTTVECGRRALQAGTDLLLYYREKNQFQTFYELRMALEKGEFDLDQIAQSIQRVKTMKESLMGR